MATEVEAMEEVAEVGKVLIIVDRYSDNKDDKIETGLVKEETVLARMGVLQKRKMKINLKMIQKIL